MRSTIRRFPASALRGCARDAHVARPVFAPRARLVDAPDVPQAVGARGALKDSTIERRFKRYCKWGRPCVLALPDARLGRGRATGVVTLRNGAAGPGGPAGLQNQ